MRTKNGHDVSLFDQNGPGEYPLRGYVHAPGRAPRFFYWSRNGQTPLDKTHAHDLDMLTPTPQKA